MIQPPKNQNGYIALIAVLIVVVTTLAIGLSLNSLSIGETESGLLAQQSVQSQALADSCLQEAYQKLRLDPLYAGESLNLGLGSCNISIIDSAPDYTVTVEAEVSSIITKAASDVTVTGQNIAVNHWQILSN